MVVVQEQFPRLVTVAAVVLAFAFQTLDAIEGRHARRIRYLTFVVRELPSIPRASAMLSLCECWHERQRRP